MKVFKKLFCGALCAAACVTSIAYYNIRESGNNSLAEGEIQALTLWQIDSFEGGTGSRAGYLQEKANAYKQSSGVYLNVLSLSAEAARANFESGNIPDIVSFGSGEYGFESVINTSYQIQCWCYGGYCLLSLGDKVDFSLANAENTVINGGKDNLAECAAVMLGLGGADIQSATYAYVDLINGKYDFLLGTQRDIYRLNARKVSYSVEPVTIFNDLYQLIAVTATDEPRAEASNLFIEYIIENNSDVYTLGLLGGKEGVNDKIAPLEMINYEYTLKTPVTLSFRQEVEEAVKTKNINKLKKLLK